MKVSFWLLLLIAFILSLNSCNQKEKSGKYDHLDHRTKIRLRQYLAEGKKLYEFNCANCHQLDGSGLARLYPPLKNSDYIIPNKTEVICGIRYGQKGDLMVNGILFNQEMPPNPNLTDLEIAEIATYVFTEFADSVQIITLNEIAEIMKSCQADSLTGSNF